MTSTRWDTNPWRRIRLPPKRGNHQPILLRKRKGKRKKRREDEAASLLGQDYRPIILPRIWSMNKFVPKMTKDVFGRLHPHFQIPDDIPIRIARKVEKC